MQRVSLCKWQWWWWRLLPLVRLLTTHRRITLLPLLVLVLVLVLMLLFLLVGTCQIVNRRHFPKRTPLATNTTTMHGPLLVAWLLLLKWFLSLFKGYLLSCVGKP
jgi:hypothetical protein